MYMSIRSITDTRIRSKNYAGSFVCGGIATTTSASDEGNTNYRYIRKITMVEPNYTNTHLVKHAKPEIIIIKPTYIGATNHI